MTIKEIEERSGLQRSNIRFYEQEGLLTPQRRSNGYRDYSENDLQQLHRIHLLRTLGVSLEDIRAAQKGELALDQLLEDRAAALEQQAADALQRAQLCRQIRQDGVQYSTLDGRHYLNALTAAEPAVAAVPKEDTYHKVTAPWRRLFARCFDLSVYSTIWILLGVLLLRQGPSTEAGSAWYRFGSFIAILMMLLVEPLFLSTWGTTPGKWLLGLSVRNNTGSKLTYGEGFYRTAQAMWSGAGMFIPIFELFRGYQRYYDCIEGKTLDWEWDSELQLKDEKNWRIAAYTGGVVALLGLVVLATAVSASPAHRGDMTVTQFARSYNQLAQYYGYELWLDDEGRWTEKPRPDGSVVIHLDDIPVPDFTYTEENGLMTGLSFTLTVDGDTESWVPIATSRRILAILAFAQAYDPTPLNNNEVIDIANRLEQTPAQPLNETVHGVCITWNITSTGYHVVDNMGVLVPIDGQTPSCSMTFTLEKVS